MTGTRVGLVVGVSLLGGALAVGLPHPEAAQAPPVKRTIYMAAVEPRGGTSVTSEPFPTAALPDGPGYVLRPPDPTGRWEVSTYQWQPAFILANEREDVALEIIGIHGAEHPSFIEGINVPPFVVKRGNITRVEFRTARPGFYRIVCSTHQPTMVGYLVVLPRR